MCEGKSEGGRLHVDARERATFDFRHGMALKPGAIFDKLTQRNGGGKGIADSGAKSIQGERRIGVRDVGGGPGGAEKHSIGHAVLPEGHGVAKNGKAKSLDAVEMSSGREAEGSGAENGYVTVEHELEMAGLPRGHRGGKSRESNPGAHRANEER